MLQHKVSDDVIEFMGTNVLAILNVINGKKSNDIKPNRGEYSSIGMEVSVVNERYWYPLNTILSAFDLMLEKRADNTLFSLGRHVLDYARFPQIDNIHDALSIMDKVYHMNCSYTSGESFYDYKADEMQEGIGHYRYVKVPDENEAFMVCDNPFPCDFDRGLITKIAQAFDKSAKVLHDDQFGCRKKGKHSCRYIIIW